MVSMTDKLFHLSDWGGWTRTVELCEQTLAVDSAAIELCAGLGDEQLSWRPATGKWSIAENLAHLRTTAEVFLPAVDSALEASKKQQLFSQGPFHLNLYGRLMVWRMDARPMFKLQAPKAIQPKLLPSPGLELKQLLISQAAIRQRIRAADGLDLTALRFPSPLASYFRVNLLEFFSVFNAHSRRHLRQANHVRRVLPMDTRHYAVEARR